jgi:16S rRNA C1402 N4-methylase RsmH
MAGIHWALSRVQHRAVVISELVNTLECRKDGEFLDTSIAQNWHTSCFALKNMGYIQDAI